MKLDEIKKQNKKGTYAGVKFSSDTNNTLTNYGKENSIPNMVPKSKFHTTLLYSRKHCPDYKPQGDIDPAFIGIPLKFDVWQSQPDENGHKANCLVLEYKCKELDNRHEELMKEHDATYDYDKYKTHLTLSYDIGDMNIKSFPKFEDDIEIVKEYYEPLNLNWAKDNTGKKK